VEKDPEKALSLKRESLPEDWESDPSVLNGFAWWCFENKINLEEAEELAQKAVSISEFGPEQANYLDTLAELVNLRGDAEGAVELIKKALEMNPESQYLKDQLVKFQETLAVTG
jgi:tetratricopeptide (TPR) repeat protein